MNIALLSQGLLSMIVVIPVSPVILVLFASQSPVIPIILGIPVILVILVFPPTLASCPSQQSHHFKRLSLIVRVVYCPRHLSQPIHPCHPSLCSHRSYPSHLSHSIHPSHPSHPSHPNQLSHPSPLVIPVIPVPWSS